MNNNIMFFLSEIKYSGASKIALWVASILAKSNNVTILTYTYPSDTIVKSIQSNVKIEYIECKSSNRAIQCLNAIKGIRKHIIRNHVNIALGFHPMAIMEIRIASLFTNVKIIACERSDPWYERAIVTRICRWTYRFADYAVFQTDAVKNYYPKSLRKRSCVIPNPAFVKEVSIVPYAERKEKISHVARLYIVQKRQDLLIDAFELFSKKHKNVELFIYGDGPDEDLIREMLIERGLDKKVILAGKVDNVLEKISDSKLFILSSDYEGIPNAVIEALSVGIPCVCTDCSPGGARILIEDGDNGFIVPRNDAVALSTKAEEVFANPELAKKMSENALLIVDKFSESAISSKWCEVIYSLL